MKHSRQPCFRLPVSGDEVVRIALAAYFRAGADATAPIGDPNPLLWSDADTFIVTLCDAFELRLRCEAARAGHVVQAEHERYARWRAQKPFRDLHISEVDPELWAQVQAGAGQRPAVTAQGCAALAVGAGAPSLPSPDADITSPDDRLSFSPEGQELPLPGIHADNQNALEATV